MRAGARVALPADRYAAECARGAALGVADVLRELDAAVTAAAGRRAPATGR